MRSRIPSAAPPPASVGEPTHSASTGALLPETSDGVPALTCGETFPRLSVFALLLVLGQTFVVLSHTLSLRLLRRNARSINSANCFTASVSEVRMFVVCLLFAHVASYQERRLVQPPGGHQPAVDLISPLAPMYGRHGSS